MYALAFAFMWLSMWVDRFNLLRQARLGGATEVAAVCVFVVGQGGARAVGEC